MALSSFDDIRQAVRTALQAIDPDKGKDLCVCDIGPDWVVYQDPDATSKPGMFRRGYHLSGDKAVLDQKPVAVARVTTYEPVDGGSARNLKEAGDRAYKLVKAARPTVASDGD